jgi:hypothetical protein
MSSQKLQDSLNQMSLVMTTSEEIMTACKKGEVHPLLAEVLVKMHTQQKDVDEAIKVLRTSQVEMAKVMDRMASLTSASYATITTVAERSGIDFSNMAGSEGIEG